MPFSERKNMTQSERREYLISELLKEQPQFSGTKIPPDPQAQKYLLRSLFNIRMPKPAGEEFTAVQDAYLQEETRKKGITDIAGLQPVRQDIYLWKGDITTLRCGAAVNAANSSLLGCFHPNHRCIDNAIHTYAGIQLRLACAELMSRQGHEEETGRAKLTPAFNLPCRYILHTVGPIVSGSPTPQHKALLASCYRSCLELAEENRLDSIAFSCISTGEFRFPQKAAAEIALQTVKNFKAQNNCRIKVIFNVFTQTDYEIYRKLLTAY